MRSYFAAWGDREAYAVSHVGWGMNPAARWDCAGDVRQARHQRHRAARLRRQLPVLDRRQRGRRAATRSATSTCPMRGCTVELDGTAVVVETVRSRANWHEPADAASFCTASAAARRRVRPARRVLAAAAAGRRAPGTSPAMATPKPSSRTPSSASRRLLLDMLDRESIARCILVGHSMGGMVAQELYAAAPGRVAAARARAHQPGLRQPRRGLPATLRRGAHAPAGRGTDHGRRRPPSGPWNARPEADGRGRDPRRDGADGGGAAGHLPQAIAATGALRPARAARAHRGADPVPGGAGGPHRAARGDREAWPRRFRAPSIAACRGLGHLAPIENPQAFCEAVESFPSGASQ